MHDQAALRVLGASAKLNFPEMAASFLAAEGEGAQPGPPPRAAPTKGSSQYR